jgi:hypothetical protein
MISDRDTFKCVRGDMSLSRHLREGLLAVYMLHTRTSSQRSLKRRIGGQWYCPDTGTPLSEENGLIACPQCDNVLNEFMLELIELHPHKPVR